MATVAYPLRVPEEIMNLAKFRAKEEYVDKSTALRQLLHLGSEEYVLRLVSGGRISIGKGAELLNVTIYDMHELAQKHSVELGATAEQMRKSKETLNMLLKKAKH